MALGGTVRGTKTTLRMPVEADLDGHQRWAADLAARRAHSVWHEPAMPATWKERLAEAAKDKQTLLWSIDAEGTLVGFAVAHLWSLGNAVDINRFLVEPERWRKGYGFDAALALHRYFFHYLALLPGRFAPRASSRRAPRTSRPPGSLRGAPWCAASPRGAGRQCARRRGPLR